MKGILLSVFIGFLIGYIIPFDKDDREYTIPLFMFIGLFAGLIIYINVNFDI